MSSSSNTTDMDNDDLLLRTMMGWLYIDPHSGPSFSQSNDADNKVDKHILSQIYKEEAEMEEEIIKIIHSDNGIDMLKPNTGKSVTIRGHSICVTMTEEKDPDRREWEWHGFIVGYDSENRYSPEYTYGFYTEELVTDELCDVVDANLEGMGLRMFGGNHVSSGRILHQNNMSAGSSRFT